MADAEREAKRTGEWEDAELVCEGWQVWLGLERFHRNSVNQLLGCLAIRASTDMGETPQRFLIADTGRAILRRPQLEDEIKVALYAGEPFTIKGNRITALRIGPSYLGRGQDDIGGQPFGYAHMMERDEIRAHLKARGRYRQGWSEFEVSKIQHRLHRYKPTFAQRQEAARARGERWVSPPPQPPLPQFTTEELERLIDLFADANDPLTASIADKATAMLERALRREIAP